jgi:hypothetical protein
MASANSKLSNLVKLWKEAEPIAPSFSSVPEGDYVAALREMKQEESKKGRTQIVSTYEIVDGEYTGEKVKRFDGLEDKQQIGYFKGMCEIIGMDIPEDFEVLQEAMDEFVGSCGDLFDIHVAKSKSEDGTKDYTNIYINGVSDLVLGEEGQEEVQEEEVAEEVEEEVVEEEAVEEEVLEEEAVEEEVVEEEPQQIIAPMKRFSSKPAQKANSKPATLPQTAKQAVRTATAKPTATRTVSQPVKKAAPVTAGRRIAAVKK